MFYMQVSLDLELLTRILDEDSLTIIILMAHKWLKNNS